MPGDTSWVGKLAVEGGMPIRPSLLPYARHQVDEADIAAVAKVLRSEWLTTGPMVGAFEAAFAAAVGAGCAVAVANGTAALHAAAAAAGVGPGSEVIVPAITFVASANCARYLGAEVRFADVRADSLCVDPSSVAALVTERTRAIVAVDFAGQPADYAELCAVAKQHQLVLIADAAHALGASYDGRSVGTLADLTAFSLHPVKHITTGEGGMVVTDNAELARSLVAFRSHGIAADHRVRERTRTWEYDMTSLGYNYRLSDVQCALGISQLAKAAGWLARRNAIAEHYTRAFVDEPALECPAVLGGRNHAWHLYVVRLHLDALRVGRTEIFRALRAENIGVNVHYVPVPWHSYYQKLGCKRGSWPIAEREYERLLSLPIWPGMTDADVLDVIKAMNKVLAAYRR